MTERRCTGCGGSTPDAALGCPSCGSLLPALSGADATAALAEDVTPP